MYYVFPCQENTFIKSGAFRAESIPNSEHNLLPTRELSISYHGDLVRLKKIQTLTYIYLSFINRIYPCPAVLYLQLHSQSQSPSLPVTSLWTSVSYFYSISQSKISSSTSSLSLCYATVPVQNSHTPTLTQLDSHSVTTTGTIC